MNDEERELYRQEVEWRSKEIEDLKLIPGWNYGRNLWQTIAYYVNKTLWSNKDWWY